MEPASRYWVHDLSPFVFQFGDDWGIRWYGMAYAAGMLIALGLLWLYDRRGRSPIAPAQFDFLMIALIAGILVGGRLGYVLLYRPDLLWPEPWRALATWSGGMASHGGFFGVFVALLVFCRKFKYSVRGVGDLLVTVAPPGILLGRLANFVNGELWGKITDAPWAVIFPGAQVPPHFDPSAFTAPARLYEGGALLLANPRHPSQLYAAALEGLLLGLYLQLRFWLVPKCWRAAHPGHLAGEFMLVYGLMRVISEAYREPDAALIFGLSRGTFYSLFMFAIGALLIFWAYVRPPWEKKSAASA